MIKVSIKQICDGCGDSRELDPSHVKHKSLDQTAQLGGWREIKPDKHICPICINLILVGTPRPKQQNPHP